MLSTRTGLSPTMADFPDSSSSYTQATGLVRVRSPLLTESRLMSFPPGTEMFQFPGFASEPMYSVTDTPKRWVSPFGNPRIKACSQLPVAYRSVPRPSSPLMPRHPPDALFLRKEVIQPQVPLRLPCYDFTPVTDPTVVGCLLAVSAPASGKTNSHGVTGGVYKARERIHRGMLIRDY
jgi:hypothetical protein